MVPIYEPIISSEVGQADDTQNTAEAEDLSSDEAEFDYDGDKDNVRHTLLDADYNDNRRTQPGQDDIPDTATHQNIHDAKVPSAM
jgi:hypothetical protein